MENEEADTAEHQHPPPSDCPEIPAQTPAVEFKKLVSWIGHARFRRGPAQPPSAELQETPPAVGPAAALHRHARMAATAVPQAVIWNFAKPNESTDSSALFSSSSLLPSRSGGDECGRSGKRSSVAINPAVVFSAGKPPLAPSCKRKCSESARAEDAEKAAVSMTRRCHCSKKRRSSKAI